MELSRPADSQIAAASRPHAGRDVSAAPVKELERTIAGFQAILTDGDRRKLQQLKTTSHDSQSIITFTAELDLLDKNRRGKSVASRLASFLQTIEQFTPISELRGYVEDIRAKAEEVQGDIQLAKAQCDRVEQQLQTTERRDASNHRKRLMAWTSKATGEMEALQAQRRRNESEQKRRRFLEELSSFNFTSGFNSTRNKRHIGTAKWVFETPEFQKWVGIDWSPVLYITGKIGSGKTVLSSSIVEKLSQVRPPQQFVSFFFVRFDDPLSLDADTILRSCVQQLISAINIDTLDQQIASELDKSLSEAKWSLFSLESLSKLYLSAAQAIEHWFMVVDGLDECNNDQQSRLLRFFQGLLSGNNTACKISILISSRETCTNAIKSTFPGSQRLTTGLESTSADIGSYVDDIIIDKISTGELVISDPNLLNEILETIASKEQGMFLWAFFAIEDICSRKTDPEIRQALQLIPADLPATFDRALGRIVKRRNQDVAKKAFMWANATLQPLTLPQLREALSIKPGQHTLCQEDLISGIERLTAWCENLIYVEETDNTVRFSHHSIQEYLLASNSGEHRALHIDPGQSDKLAGEVCITYVNLDNFQTTLAERKEETLTPSAMKIDPSGIAEQTIQTAIQGGVGTRVGRLARQFVKTSNTNKTSTQHEFSLGSVMPVTSKAQGAADYPFLEYASTNWFKHTKNINKDETDIWRLFGQLVQKPAQHSQGEPWNSTEWKKEAVTGFPNYADSRSKCFSNVIRYQVSGNMTGIEPPSSDVPEFSHLLLAFLYAELNGYIALACRSYQLLIGLHVPTEEFGKLVCFLLANKSHMACRNDCASFASWALNHGCLVEELRKAIVRGISYFPAMEGPMTGVLCDCADSSPLESRRDICHVLEAGYRQVSEPHLQAFAIMVERMKARDNIPTLSKLMDLCSTETGGITKARNTHGMLLFDVLIQWGVVNRDLHDLRGRVRPLSYPIAMFMGYTLLPTFKSELGDPDSHHSPPRLSPLKYTICFLSLLEDGVQGEPAPKREEAHRYALSGALFKLHGDTIATIFHNFVIRTLWEPYMATYIVKTLFCGSSRPAPKHIVFS
ncbi:heterokaryon incompatibility protein het-E-1 [Fusarium coicis]|nr:heterokaryon incompatibility protein het-E-1 [Fusarium coicis]